MLSNNTSKENTNKNYILMGNYVTDYKLQQITATDSKKGLLQLYTAIAQNIPNQLICHHIHHLATSCI